VSQAVTLTIVNYNKAPYVLQALESVLDQSIRPAQVILYDDCSTDGSDRVLKQFAQQHDGWVRFLQSPCNLGSPAASFNRAINHVRTELMADMSADDFLHPDCLKHLLAKYRSGSYDLLIANVIAVDIAGEEIGKHFAYVPDDSDARQAILEYDIYSARLKLARTAFLRQIGSYCEDLKTHEDHELLIRAALKGTVAYCVPAIYYWRNFEGNLTSTLRSDRSEWETAFKYVYDRHYRLWPLSKQLGLRGAVKARQGYRRRVGLPTIGSPLGLRKILKRAPALRAFYRRASAWLDLSRDV
jgi:glycosyltransferase involved in cell wall biosynthesis